SGRGARRAARGLRRRVRGRRGGLLRLVGAAARGRHARPGGLPRRGRRGARAGGLVGPAALVGSVDVMLAWLVSPASAGSIPGLDSDPGEAEPYVVAIAADGFPEQYLGPGYTDEDAATFAVARGETVDAGEWALLDGIAVSGTVAGPDGAVASGEVYVYSSSQ